MSVESLKKEILQLQEQLQQKQSQLDKLVDEEESKKLPEWQRHKCIDCGRHRAGKPVYHDGKLTGYICDSCDYEIL